MVCFRLNRVLISFLFLTVGFQYSAAQFPPQVPIDGNDGIHKSDTRIVGWATGTEIERGWINIADTTLGRATTGSAANALGISNATVVSLGDGGSITLSFDYIITNGDGPDFAVFENAFHDPEDESMAFLELAFVEVSTDGITFVRFPAISNLQLDSQITNETYSDASLVSNFAGKYISNYGTPFDLEELKDSSGIDIDNINFIRIVDVIGSIDETFAQQDHLGNVINDPWPTPFPSSGFDLESVAVLNSKTLSLDNEFANNIDWDVFPNPAQNQIHVRIDGNFKVKIEGKIMDLNGRIIERFMIDDFLEIDISNYQSGLYLIQMDNSVKKFVKL